MQNKHINIGKIYLESKLVGIACFENGFCQQYFILIEFAEELLNTGKEKYNKLPELLYEKDGLYGIHEHIYKYFTISSYSYIKFEKIITINLEELNNLFEKENFKLITDGTN